MDIDLLLNEEDYVGSLEELKQFAEKNGYKIEGTSYDLVRVVTAVMMSQELPDHVFVMMAKLIYNIGYRDNHFKSAIIH
jgi:hypothetical protein